MKIVVLGSRGQLGNELKRLIIKSGMDGIFPDSFNDKQESLPSLLTDISPDIVINCVAYTDVRKAEIDIENVFRLNARLPGEIAATCKRIGARFITFSTDYVFDGITNIPYNETHMAYPINQYGLSKLIGEKSVMHENPESCIIRTSWLYSGEGNNFVKTIIGNALANKVIEVVSDQIGTPTFAKDLAEMVMHIIKNKISGIYHYSNEGSASWYDFAHEIVSAYNIACEVIPVESMYDAVRRPSFTVLSKRKIKNDTGFRIPHWRDSLWGFMQSSM